MKGQRAAFKAGWFFSEVITITVLGRKLQTSMSEMNKHIASYIKVLRLAYMMEWTMNRICIHTCIPKSC